MSTLPNNSSTGGYLLPTPAPSPVPGNLSFEQFIQSVLVGISGLPGKLVRPKWQINPPKQPEITVDWMAFGLTETGADTFAFEGQLSGDSPNQLMRMEDIVVQTTFYGPNSYEFCKILRDGFQLGQNRKALAQAMMTFAYSDRMMRVPDLVNERWVDRWEMGVHLRREIIRTYPVLNFLSGDGTVKINNQGDSVKTVAVLVEAQES